MIEREFKYEVSTLTQNSNLADELWQEIAFAYLMPTRFYHNLSHLDNLINELNKVRSNISDWSLIVFAVAYHDIVYDTTRQDNEEQSATKAYNCLTKLDLSEAFKEKCRILILATKGHSISEESAANYLTDADLSILGSAYTDYVKYSKQIRQEYSNYGDELYNPGRLKVLNYFLNLPNIFKTDYFRDKYESQARLNIKNEILELT